MSPAPASLAAGGGGRRSGPGPLSVERAQAVRHGIALAPFTVYAALFLGAPAIAVVIGAFQSPSGGFTLHNARIAFTGAYLQGFETSLELSAITSIIPALAGALIAYAVHRGRPTSFLRRAVVTASGVFAQFGGVPLAFMFIASLGTVGLATHWLDNIGVNLANLGFNLYTLSGVAFVYMYFQIPLMVLIFLPALEGLRPSWREAAHNLGARSWQFWRYVGLPVLAPTFFGCLLLLFGFGFSAYATADALTSGSIALTPIQIGSFLNGNVIAGQQNVGKMLGLGMLVVLGVVMVLYGLIQRRFSKWVR
ncbi:MAG: binding-protein-dependent transport system inner rane component [Acidimicrobiaceae bacterium]|nr:binding-protein-dependent transport system inner rane component [Acidimicrobiaceae bacterium]